VELRCQPNETVGTLRATPMQELGRRLRENEQGDEFGVHGGRQAPCLLERICFI
jgi:hypothetical protein